jgi:hypothetical protein
MLLPPSPRPRDVNPFESVKGEPMGLKYRHLKTKPVCKVTLRVSKKASQSARRIDLVGDFNNWSITETPMKRLKNGEFTVTVDLETPKADAFRYILDGTEWENDWEADRYVPSSFAGSENAVVEVKLGWRKKRNGF